MVAKHAPLWVMIAVLAGMVILLDLFGALAVCGLDYALGLYIPGEYWVASRFLSYFAVALFFVLSIGVCAYRVAQIAKSGTDPLRTHK